MFNRQALGLSMAVALAVSVGLVAQKKDDKKQSDEQKKDIQAVVKLADDVAAGQNAPNDAALTWSNVDFLKAQGNKQYAPFSVMVDPSKLTNGNAVFYWRVVSK